MIRTALLLTLIFSAQCISAQTRLLAYTNISLSNQVYRYADDLEEIESLLKELNSPREVFSFGLGAETRLGNRVSVNYALQWLKTGSQFNSEALNFGDQIDPRRGFVYNASSTPRGYMHHYLDLPISASYTIHESEKWTQVLMAGPSLGYYMHSQMRYREGDSSGTISRRTYYRDFIMAGQAGYRVERKLNNRWSAFTSATYRKSLISMENESSLSSVNSVHTYNVGLSFGALYAFNRGVE